MKRQILKLTTCAIILVGGTIASGAQQQPGMRGQMMQQDQQQDSGMMGPGMMGQGMMGSGMMGPGMMGPGMMRMMLILVDTDGDGALSLQEYQAVHERMFKALDSDGDGRVTLEEMQSFMPGMATPKPQQQQ